MDSGLAKTAASDTPWDSKNSYPKGKDAFFFGVGTHVHGGRVLAPFPGVEVVVYAPVGAHLCLRLRHRRNMCINVQIFGDFGGGDTHGGEGPRRATRPPPLPFGRSQCMARRV
jgi:hypothetical protein